MSTPFLIPLVNTQQSMTVTLAGVQYGITIVWNDASDCWVMDIADANGNALVQGIPLVTGTDLLEQFGYLNFGGQLIVQTTNETDAVPTFANLGTLGNLFFVVID